MTCKLSVTRKQLPVVEIPVNTFCLLASVPAGVCVCARADFKSDEVRLLLSINWAFEVK